MTIIYQGYNIYDSEAQEYLDKIQENFMKMDLNKWENFCKWAYKNFNSRLEIKDKDLARSLYGQLAQCQRKFNEKLPKCKRKYEYEIPSWKSIDGRRKIYIFNYGLK